MRRRSKEEDEGGERMRVRYKKERNKYRKERKGKSEMKMRKKSYG